MQVHTHKAGIGLIVAARQQSGDDAGQHVAAARRRHAGIAGGIDDDATVGQTEGRIVPFQDNIGTQPLSHVARLGQSVVAAIAHAARETVELSRMGCHDDALRQLLHPCTVIGQDVQRVGIDEDGALRPPDLRDEGDGSVLLRADARAHAHGVEGLRVHRLREVAVLMVHLQHSLRHRHLHDGIVALRRAHRHLAGSRTQTGLRGQHGGTAHAVTAGNDECVAHLPFVGKLAAGLQSLTDVRFLGHDKHSIGAGNILLRQADVEHTQLAQEVLVVGQQHRELLLSEGQREVGFDDVLTNVVGIVLGHESRRNIDAHHTARRLVDVLHKRSKTTRQWFIESRAEQTVNNQCLSPQARRVEVERHLDEVLYAATVAQTFFVDGAFVRKLVMDIKQVDGNSVALLAQHTGNGQGIATVVAGTGKHDHGRTRVPPLGDDAGHSLGGTLHEVYRPNGLVLYGISIQLMYLSTCKNLHIYKL